MKKLSHVDSDNRPCMVDVTEKPESYRVASAIGHIRLGDETIRLVSENRMKKGNVLATAELAGIMAVKKTSELIPLCHNLLLTKIDVKAEIVQSGIQVTSVVVCTGKTGVEMEALTGVSVALLTIYDMCKAVDKSMVIDGIKLLSKTKREV